MPPGKAKQKGIRSLGRPVCQPQIDIFTDPEASGLASSFLPPASSSPQALADVAEDWTDAQRVRCASAAPPAGSLPDGCWAVPKADDHCAPARRDDYSARGDWLPAGSAQACSARLCSVLAGCCWAVPKPDDRCAPAARPDDCSARGDWLPADSAQACSVLVDCWADLAPADYCWAAPKADDHCARAAGPDGCSVDLLPACSVQACS